MSTSRAAVRPSMSARRPWQAARAGRAAPAARHRRDRGLGQVGLNIEPRSARAVRPQPSGRHRRPQVALGRGLSTGPACVSPGRASANHGGGSRERVVGAHGAPAGEGVVAGLLPGCLPPRRARRPLGHARGQRRRNSTAAAAAADSAAQRQCSERQGDDGRRRRRMLRGHARADRLALHWHARVGACAALPCSTEAGTEVGWAGAVSGWRDRGAADTRSPVERDRLAGRRAAARPAPAHPRRRGFPGGRGASGAAPPRRRRTRAPSTGARLRSRRPQRGGWADTDRAARGTRTNTPGRARPRRGATRGRAARP